MGFWSVSAFFTVDVQQNERFKCPPDFATSWVGSSPSGGKNLQNQYSPCESVVYIIWLYWDCDLARRSHAHREVRRMPEAIPSPHFVTADESRST